LNTGVFATYQWYYNGVAISGANAQTYTATATGSYRVEVTNANGCRKTSGAVEVVVIGVENIELINLRIYPNPTENVLNVHADNLTDAVSIELRDALGRLLYGREITGNTVREELDMSSYASGVYLLVIKNNTKILAAKRVFKN
jgi:hypothetical protein